jgi:hypothetical protein
MITDLYDFLMLNSKYFRNPTGNQDECSKYSGREENMYKNTPAGAFCNPGNGWKLTW